MVNNLEQQAINRSAYLVQNQCITAGRGGEGGAISREWGMQYEEALNHLWSPCMWAGIYIRGQLRSTISSHSTQKTGDWETYLMNRRLLMAVSTTLLWHADVMSHTPYIPSPLAPLLRKCRRNKQLYTSRYCVITLKMAVLCKRRLMLSTQSKIQPWCFVHGRGTVNNPQKGDSQLLKAKQWVTNWGL
jgi:hypothetical protein